MGRFMARRTSAEIVQARQLLTQTVQLEKQAQHLLADAGKLEDQAQDLLERTVLLEGQVRQLSASTVQQEEQASDSGGFGGFLGIGLLAAVLLAVVYVANKLRPRGRRTQIPARSARPSFTKKDRALIDLLSEIVDIIDSVEK